MISFRELINDFNSFLNKKKKNILLVRCFSLLSRRDRVAISLISVIQLGLGILDLIGVGVIGVLGALAVNGIQSKNPGDRITKVLTILGIENYSFQKQVAILGVIAAFTLMTKTLFSIVVSRRILFFLSRRSAVMSSKLVYKLFSLNLIEIQKLTSQQTLFSVTNGVTSITLGIIGTLVNLISDISLLVFLGVGLFSVDSQTSILIFSIFGLVAIALYLLTNKRAQILGTDNAFLTIKSNEKLLEVLNSYRESVVRNRRSYYADQIGNLRMKLADNAAEMSFMPNISKYASEATLVFGGVLISAIQFARTDATHAISTLSLFIAAGLRIAPAILRIQQGSINIKNNIGSSIPTLNLIEMLSNKDNVSKAAERPNFDYPGFSAKVNVENVGFSYTDEKNRAVTDISLEMQPGKSYAIVGPSGSGKTTLVDLILGILNPQTGKITISGKSVREAIIEWPGSISYVPQDVLLINGSIRENISLGYPLKPEDDLRIWKILEIVQLEKFVRSLPNELGSQVGERGAKISGGQKQRIGIARALFTNPKILVLDEATSSLDGITEADLTIALEKLKGEVTILMIAHRLASVKNVSKLFYLENGRIISAGTFNEVKKAVKNFEIQANIMGL